MHTTVDHMDNPRKNRTEHHCDVSYFSVRSCRQRHTLTDNNGPAQVNFKTCRIKKL